MAGDPHGAVARRTDVAAGRFAAGAATAQTYAARFEPLSPLDVRLVRELPSRRALAHRARRVLRVTGRVLVDASLIAAGAVLARHGAAAAGGSLGAAGPTLATGGLPSIVTTLLVALLALAAAGEYEIAGRRHHSLATPFVASGVLALVLPILAADLHLPLDGRALAVLMAGIALPLTLIVLVRRRFGRRGDGSVALRGALVIGRARDLPAAVAALGGGDGHQIVDRLPSAPDSGGAPGPLLSQLARRLARGDVSEVIVVSVVRARTLRALAASCWRAGVRCLVALDAQDVRIDGGIPVTIGGYSATEIVPNELRLPRLPLKRALDIVLTLLILVVALPLCAIVAIAIRLESRGPVIYRQRRVGLGGRQFTIWKFRSMRCGTHVTALSHLNSYGEAPLFKLKDDPRITRVGRLLRRTSLDELPQLINVLRGEMSLVGPRPPLPEEVSRYQPHHLVRLSVVPGMTGPWQVGGRNLITDFEEIVRMERAYIDEWSLGLDLRIMARTVGVVVAGTGAY